MGACAALQLKQVDPLSAKHTNCISQHHDHWEHLPVWPVRWQLNQRPCPNPFVRTCESSHAKGEALPQAFKAPAPLPLLLAKKHAQRQACLPSLSPECALLFSNVRPSMNAGQRGREHAVGVPAKRGRLLQHQRGGDRKAGLQCSPGSLRLLLPHCGPGR